MSMTTKADKTMKTLDLALSESRIGNTNAAATAAYRAGALAHAAGITCETLDTATGAGTSAYDCVVWSALVDGWHDAADRASRRAA